MLDKLEHGHVHVAAFGRVSVGKSALLNALLGEQRFLSSPLHGETQRAEMSAWREYDAGGVFLIDTPGLNEVDGAAREQLARDVARRADLVLFVVDADLSATELEAFKAVTASGRAVILVLNKADRYTTDELDLLIETIQGRTSGLIDQLNIVAVSAQPSARIYIEVDESGHERETTRPRPPDIGTLKTQLWDVLDRDGKTLAALNASLFAGDLSDQVAVRILQTRRKLGERVITTYCVAKGVAVALNPVPVADLFAAAFVDIGMIVHLSRVYGLPLTRVEAGSLISVVITQMAVLMGTVWAVHLVSSMLKLSTGGLSTLVTAGAQGAVAYYSTYVVAKVAEQYLAQGKSWGDGGPKQVVGRILASLDRESIIAQGREDIRARLRSNP